MCIQADYYLNKHKTLHMMEISTDIFVLSIIKLGNISLFFLRFRTVLLEDFSYQSFLFYSLK